MELDTEVIITGFKVAGAFIGGALGVVGVLFNFKKSNGRVSGWGIIVILGIVLSATVGIITSITEGIKARLEAAQQAARTEQILKELSRAIQPITELSITQFITLPSEAPVVHSYLQKMSKRIEARATRLKDFPIMRDPDLSVDSIDRDGPVTVSIPPKSKFWPSGDEMPIGHLTTFFNFTLYFSKTPIEAENFDGASSVNDGRSDWIAVAIPSPHGNTLHYKPRSGDLEIFGTAAYNKNLWRSNGKITSVDDLHGAQLFLVPPFPYPRDLPQLNAKSNISAALQDLLRMIDLRAVALNFGGGREIWIDSKAFKKTQVHGYSVYSIILPDSDEGFARIRPRE
jgi:hypothetical protein